MFVSNPSFQRPVILESDPKGNLSHPALLLCLWLTVVCQPELQNTQAVANKKETQHTSWLWGFSTSSLLLLDVVSIIIICVAISLPDLKLGEDTFQMNSPSPK